MMYSIYFFISLVFATHNLVAYVPAQVQAFKQALAANKGNINCANCDFRGVQDLQGLDAHGVFMPGVQFQPCLTSDINKSSLMVCTADKMANLMGINLSHATLFSSCFDFAQLDQADLSGADLTNASMQHASLKDAKLNNIIATNATFCDAIMPDGTVCKDSWTGQGITVACNCSVTK